MRLKWTRTWKKGERKLATAPPRGIRPTVRCSAGFTWPRAPRNEKASFWTVSIDERQLATGYAISDRDAAQAVEDAYFAELVIRARATKFGACVPR